MPDETPQLRKVAAVFKRKVNIEALGGPKYENAELLLSVDDYVPLDAAPEYVVSVLRDLASTVKATALDEMNLEWEATEDGIVIERLRGAFLGATVTTAKPATTSRETLEGNASIGQRKSSPTPDPQVVGGPTQAQLAAVPPYAGEKLDFKADKAKVAEQREWAIARYLTNPDEFWDNRESKPKSTSADFRHKEYGVSIWQDAVDKARAAA